MTARQIVKWNAPILTTAAGSALQVSPQVIQDLKDTLRNEPRAHGLAAQQIGELCRAIVIRDKNGGPLVMVRPVISNASGVSVETELCMSFPCLKQKVARYYDGVVHWEDADTGEKRDRFFSGLTFRVIQHEINHLDGITLPMIRRREREKAAA